MRNVYDSLDLAGEVEDGLCPHNLVPDKGWPHSSAGAVGNSDRDPFAPWGRPKAGHEPRR